MFVPNMARVGRAQCDRIQTNLGQFWDKFGRTRVRFGHRRSSPVQSWPNLAHVKPNLSKCIGRVRAKCGHIRDKLGRSRAKFVQFRVNIGRFWRISRRDRANFGRCWSVLTVSGPRWVEFCWLKSGHVWAIPARIWSKLGELGCCRAERAEL